MTHTWKRLVLPAAVAAAALALSACAPPADSGSRPSSGALVVNMVGAPATLDPAAACSANDMHLMENLYARLVDYGKKPGPVDGTTIFDAANIVPSFAESWDISNDGLRYIFDLVEGATLPSGKPMDAAVVKYSLDRSIAMGLCGESYLNDGSVAPNLIESIEVVDEQTVAINLAFRDQNFLQALAQPAASIVDPELIEANGGIIPDTPNEYFSGHVVGATGPFVLEEYEPGKSATLGSNPNFFGDAPVSDRIVVNFVSSTTSLLLQARNGQADVTIGLPREAARSLEGDDCCVVVPFPSAMALDLALNWRAAPFDNLQFREALTYAFPYDEMRESVGYGYGETFYGPFTPDMKEFDTALGAAREYDPERAAELIAESGIEPSFELAFPNDQEELREVATAVQAALAPVGITVTVREVPAAERRDVLYNGDYEAFIIAGGPGIVDAGYFLAYDMSCESPHNISGICVPAADAAWAEARQELDPDQQQALWDEVTVAWSEASAKVKLWSIPAMVVFDSERVSSVYYSIHANFSSWG